MTGCQKVIIKVPPPCPQPGPNVGQQWEEKHIVTGSGMSYSVPQQDLGVFTVYELAPAVGTYMAEIKRYCKGIDEFREN